MPLTLAGVSAAYNSIAKSAASSPGMAARDGAGPDFASMVQDAAKQGVNALKEGEAASMLGVAAQMVSPRSSAISPNEPQDLKTAVRFFTAPIFHGTDCPVKRFFDFPCLQTRKKMKISEWGGPVRQSNSIKI